jgi:hypothetical protein
MGSCLGFVVLKYLERTLKHILHDNSLKVHEQNTEISQCRCSDTMVINMRKYRHLRQRICDNNLKSRPMKTVALPGSHCGIVKLKLK